PAERPLFRVLTPLAKYWITARARTVAAEAMSVRGGNGYIEEWVNPRLVRDSFLGAIWEGASNVVALDVQRAIVRDACHQALFAFVRQRLDMIREPAAAPWSDTVRAAVDAIDRQIAAWPALSPPERELRARPLADALYHVLATSLLLAEGQMLYDRSGSFRKFLAAALYAHRWLRPTEANEPAFSVTHLAWLDALVDWTDVPRRAVTEVE